MVRTFRCFPSAASWLLLTAALANAQQNPPIIDVHVHSFGPLLDDKGRPAPIPCLNDRIPCDSSPSSFATKEAVIAEVVAAMKRHNIVMGVLLGGPLEEEYLRAGEGRFLRAGGDTSLTEALHRHTSQVASERSTPVTRSVSMAGRKKARASTKRSRGATDDAGCDFVVEWKVLKSLDGMTPIWIPTEAYERVAKALLSKTKDRYARRMLRARMAPLGVWHVCKGTCSGGWCKERVLVPDEFSALSVCECQYFV